MGHLNRLKHGIDPNRKGEDTHNEEEKHKSAPSLVAVLVANLTTT